MMSWVEQRDELVVYQQILNDKKKGELYQYQQIEIQMDSTNVPNMCETQT